MAPQCTSCRSAHVDPTYSKAAKNKQMAAKAYLAALKHGRTQLQQARRAAAAQALATAAAQP